MASGDSSGGGERREAPIFGRYRLLELVGRGGFSTVYRAELLGEYGFRKQVALKVLHRRLRSVDDPVSAEFLNEARLGASIQHPNLVEFYECGRVGDRLYIAMELIEGPSLAQLMDVTRLLTRSVDAGVILEITMQVARGLQGLHKAVVAGLRIEPIHHDMKPGNILLSPNGQAKITDYGIARFAADFYQTLGMEGVRGSPMYMAPEQARGETPTQASDVFAFGSLVLELVTGRPVFKANTLQDVIARVQRADASEALSVARQRLPQLVTVLENCMLADPGLRYHDGDELVQGLKGVQPPPFGEELIAELATEAYDVLKQRQGMLRDRHIETFWGLLDEDEEESVSVPLDESYDQEALDGETSDIGMILGAGMHQVAAESAVDSGEVETATSEGPLVERDEGGSGPSEEGGVAETRRGGTGSAVPWAVAAAAIGALLAVVLITRPWGWRTSTASPADEFPPTDAHADRESARAPETDEEQTPESPDQTATNQTDAVDDPADNVSVGDDRPVSDGLVIEHETIRRGVRGRDMPARVTVTPPGNYRATIWYRGVPGGSWQTADHVGGDHGMLTMSIPSGGWQTQDVTAVEYFIEVRGPDGIVRSGSTLNPHSYPLY